QARGGIRAFHVTGVQTCALPILLSVTSEIFPLVKTGGLADVAGALPVALAGKGVAMRSLVPGYPAVMATVKKAIAIADYPALFEIGRASCRERVEVSLLACACKR